MFGKFVEFPEDCQENFVTDRPKKSRNLVRLRTTFPPKTGEGRRERLPTFFSSASSAKMKKLKKKQQKKMKIKTKKKTKKKTKQKQEEEEDESYAKNYSEIACSYGFQLLGRRRRWMKKKKMKPKRRRTRKQKDEDEDEEEDKAEARRRRTIGDFKSKFFMYG